MNVSTLGVVKVTNNEMQRLILHMHLVKLPAYVFEITMKQPAKTLHKADVRKTALR